MNRREALLILNVNQKSSQEEIKTSYRKMALELHPDKNKAKGAKVAFKIITEAYNFLKKNENDVSSVMSTSSDLQKEYDDLHAEIDKSEADLENQAVLVKGMKLYTDKKWEEAISYLKKVKPLSAELQLENSYTEMGHIDGLIGTCFIQMGKNVKAITYFDKVLSVDPENEMALNLKGHALRNLKKYDEAIVNWNILITIDEKNNSAWSNKGEDLFKLSKYNEAIFCYDKALKIDPDDEGYWFNKGEALDKLSKYPESVLCYEKGLKINPDTDISDWSSCDGSAMESLDAVKAKLSKDSSSKTAEKIEIIEKSEPLDVLKMRLVKGEITLEEFNKIKDIL